jgi:heme oxygenase
MNAMVEVPGRATRLKLVTQAVHERLDARIMATGLFASREVYGLFLRVQHAFHRDIDALYANTALERLLPGLEKRRRLPLIEADLADLGIEAPATRPAFGADADVPTALGWLYVAEGSNLGAAFLLKDAAKLGLDETFGARHLAPAPEGRGLAWRTFTAALDAPALTEEEEQRVIEGAMAAFTRVQGLVEALMPLAADSRPSGRL